MADITLLDWFAAHAPNKVPDWFRHEEYPGKPVAVPPPRKPDDCDYRDWEYAREAESEEASVRPELTRLWVEYQGRLADYRERLEAWEREDAAERFFEWRWHYARTMLRLSGVAQAAAEDEGR